MPGLTSATGSKTMRQTHLEEFDISPTASQRAGLSTVDQSINSSILTQLRSMRSSIDQSINEISSSVDLLSEKINGPSTSARCSKRSSEYVPTGNRADDDSSSVDRPLPNWSNNEEDSCSAIETVKLAESDEKLVQSAFSHTLSNSERQRIRNGYPITGSPAQTKCPQLDPVIKSSIAGKPHDTCHTF